MQFDSLILTVTHWKNAAKDSGPHHDITPLKFVGNRVEWRDSVPGESDTFELLR